VVKTKTEHQKGVLAIVMLTVCYGILPLIPRYLSISFELFQQVYLRLTTGFLLSFLFFRKKIDISKIIKLPIKDWGFVALRAFVYYFMGVILYTQALLLTKISNVAFIGAIPMTAILGFVFLKEKFTAKKALLVLLSFLGVVFISIQDYSNLLHFGRGEIVAILSAFFISLAFISRKWQTKVVNDEEVATLMLFFAALFVFGGSLIRGEGLPTQGWHLGIILALLLGGLLNVGVSFLMNYGFARLEAVLASNLIALDPVFAALFAFLVFSEVPVVKEVIGGTVIISSAIMMDRLESRKNSVE
jgi:drug/metabolite transporter (DMT)-like permease